MVLVQKWPFFQLFFRQHRPGQCGLRYFRRKNAFLGYKNKKFKKSKSWHFSKGVNPWFWSKNGHFSDFFFLGNIGQENFFYDVLQRKNAFLGCKNQKFKKSKNWHSSKGVNPWLWPGKCGLRYSRTKKRQIRSSKSRKIDIFPKGLTHNFGAKIAI